ncbi:MAG: malate dehydrogenase [Leptospiraceae bacterium]|nr:malate dehydrogenase [Leptospiraceae bacterium]MCK6380231.1 malate dehydrogenase [Leptospiraceae bacterium]NUM42522.1 malate dehydrogenase [Leptospiraceae bacterium]
MASQSTEKEEALKYHSDYPKGKTSVVSTKATSNSHDLSLAYTPGVAYPCLEIQKDKDLSYQYTNRGNLVGIITNGTAVLGLGDIGAASGKPVMEGKAVLFKKFAGIDVFDIELDTKNPEEFIRAVKLMEPTFGGINLEDIKAPECFHIEQTLIDTMDIPVFHDDQHGTSIIVTAALINALYLNGKNPSKIKVVISGAGAAAVAIAYMICNIGIQMNNIFLVDSKGVINHKRTDLNEIKKQFIRNTDKSTLDEIMEEADLLIGVSNKDIVSKSMVKKMSKDPIIFALSNPDPEISYDDAISVRNDLIMGTGRSDFPNQVNNLLGFPYIFRGALDVRSRQITLEMRLAAAYALAELAREPVPDEVAKAYFGEKFHFGKDYIIPKPFDKRALFKVAPAVAEAAVNSKVARIPYIGREKYIQELKKIQRE